MTTPTLQSTLSSLSTLARETGADYQSTLRVEPTGVLLVVHWTGTNDADLPRECHAFFGADDIQGFLWALCYDPTRFMSAIEEGLSDEMAEVESRGLVEKVEDMLAYIQALPYAAVRAKSKGDSWEKGLKAMLDKGAQSC